MADFIAYEKLSKKKKRELDALRRKTWGQISPVTRRPENPKAYDRKKARNRRDDYGSGSVLFVGWGDWLGRRMSARS